jgi:hypothetical protein
MAKELPYFRFTPQEWQNGDISLERLELRGLFIDICCYYWIKDCSINVAMLKKRYSNDIELINELIENEIISTDENDEFVIISFLDEQFDVLSEQRKRRQNAGSKGGKQKSSNAKAMLKQKSSYKDKDKDKDKEKIIVEVEKKVTDGKQLYDFLKNISQDRMRELKEFTLYSGTDEELDFLMKKIAVEFISRYGLNKTLKEAEETFKSWMARERSNKASGKKQNEPIKLGKSYRELLNEINESKK